MRTIQPQILEIPGAKQNGKKIFENMGIPREFVLVLNILENAVPLATGLSKIQRELFG